MASGLSSEESPDEEAEDTVHATAGISAAAAGAAGAAAGVTAAAAVASHSRGGRRRANSPDWQSAIDHLMRTTGLRGSGLEAMRAVDRADFVPADAFPYIDAPQRIGHSATISAPHMHASALSILGDVLCPGARVMDVGSGSGYLSAAMALMVGPMGRVFGIDYLEPLVALSRHNVSKRHADLLESGRLVLEVGDGWQGRPEDAPFDAIHVGAAAVDVPRALVEQLRGGGRMVVPIGPQGGDQYFMQVDKDDIGRAWVKNLGSVVYVPLVKLRR